MRIRLMFLSFALVSVAHASPNAILRDWKGFSDPDIMGSGFTNKFNGLPLEGSIEIGPKAWSGHYWPKMEGSINNRWNSTGRQGFDLISPTREQAKRMSLDELAQLAPSEKYDLFTGKYDYPLKTRTIDRSNPRADEWEGICNGWTRATLYHNEPTPKVMTNPDGIQIPFGSSDIKALLSFYYAFDEKSSGNQMGKRCYFGRWLGGARSCADDLNAGAFHIVIANKLGIQKEGFMADVDRFKEVWNQPIVGFKSKVLQNNLEPSRKAAKNTVKEIRVITELFYVDELDAPTWDVVHGTKHQLIASRHLQYRLEISAENKIIGGEWESDERPDFLWRKPKASSFEGILSALPLLLND